MLNSSISRFTSTCLAVCLLFNIAGIPIGALVMSWVDDHHALSLSSSDGSLEIHLSHDTSVEHDAKDGTADRSEASITSEGHDHDDHHLSLERIAQQRTLAGNPLPTPTVIALSPAQCDQVIKIGTVASASSIPPGIEHRPPPALQRTVSLLI